MPQPDPPIFHDDCRHYLGDRPCRHNRLCNGCPHYRPHGRRTCIIKVGALGDVIRTLCILPHLKREDPDGHVTWVTSPAAMAFIARHPQIDRLMPFGPLTALTLAHERFDTLINLDKEPEPCALAMAARADRKLGIGLGDSGRPVPLNDEARPYFALGLSDELKFHRNRLSYPELVYGALGWAYDGQRYVLPVEADERDAAGRALAERGWSPDRPTVGVNVGAASTFANKMWPTGRIVDLLERLHTAAPTTQVVLLGGAAERDRMNQTRRHCPWVVDGGADNGAQRFIAMIDHCDAVFCGDTLAMHLAIARGRGVVAFFGPTCEQEIDLFGLGEKLVARTPCSPCYKRLCDHADACLDAVSTAEALSAIRRVLDRRLAEAPARRRLVRAG